MKPYQITTLADVQPEKVEWLWNGRIPLAKHTDVCGDPGRGKSTMLLDIAARVTRCLRMPDGSPGVHGAVVMLTAEDGLADTIRPRFDAADGDPAWLHAFTVGEDGDLPVFPENASELEAVIHDTCAKMVILDPIVAFLGPSINSWRDQDVRRALASLTRIAERTRAAIVTIRHFTKAEGSPALYRGGGSIGFVGAVRAAFLVAPDPEESDLTVFAAVKSNLCRRPPALSFRIEPRDQTSRIQWVGESNRTADELVTPRNLSAEGAVSAAEVALRDLLYGGPAECPQVLAAMRERGIADRTVYRAANRMKVVRTSSGYGAQKRSVWSLPVSGAELPSLSPGSNGEIGRIEQTQCSQPMAISAISAISKAVSSIDDGAEPNRRHGQ